MWHRSTCLLLTLLIVKVVYRGMKKQGEGNRLLHNFPSNVCRESFGILKYIIDYGIYYETVRLLRAVLKEIYCWAGHLVV